MLRVSFVFVLFALVLAVGGGLVLYSFVRSERRQRSVTDRETAEKIARRDDAVDGSESSEDAARGNHWD